MMQKLRWIALGVLVAMAAAWGYMWLGAARLDAPSLGVSLPGGIAVGGPFTLRDSAGHSVTDQDFRGRYMLVYFGYTFCPDVCPTELQTIATALDLLGPAASRVVPLFITIDPERDTPEILANYTHQFDARLIGLTGTPDQVAAAARAYRIYYAKVTPRNGSTYLMDHSSFLYLMGPKGDLVSLFRQGTSPQELADALRARLNGG